MSARARQRQRDNGSDRPRDELAYAYEVTKPQTTDDLLRENNFGTGVYSDWEFDNQIENFKKHVYGEAAFDRRLYARAKHVTHRRIAAEGFDYEVDLDDGTAARHTIKPWDDLDETTQSTHEPDDPLASTAPAVAYVREEWEDVPPAERLRAIRRFTDYDPFLRSVMARTMMAVHELSRSKEGRMVDRSMGDYREHEGGTTDGRQSGRRRRGRE